MKLGFAPPRVTRLKAMNLPWEDEVTGAEQTELVRLAQRLGFAMVSVPEHFLIPKPHLDLSGAWYFDSFTAMAHFAGATDTIRINSCVTLLPLRHPVLTAKALSTMDWLSGGRVTVTFGVGWLKEEFDLLGAPFHERGAMADEYTRAIIELWTSDDPVFEGKYVSFRDVAFEPRCVQRPHIPIWFGGDADRMLHRAARHGTGWWPFLTRPDDIAARIDFIRSRPDYGGQLTEVFYGLGTGRVGEGHVVQEDADSRLGRETRQVIDRLGALARQGVTISGVPSTDVTSLAALRDHMGWLSEEIMPAIAGL